MLLLPYWHRLWVLSGIMLLLMVGQAFAENVRHVYFNGQGEVVAVTEAIYRRDYRVQGTQVQVQDFYYRSGQPYSNSYTTTVNKITIFTPVLREGQLILWHENGNKKVQGTFKQEQPHGTWLTWHDNGQLAASIHYRHGDAEGIGMRWYANGQRESRLLFQQGKAHGRWQQWYVHGGLKAEMMMVNGKPTVIRRWDEQGRILAELSVHGSGQQSGVVLSWYANGAKRSETIYQYDEIIKNTRWDEAGNILDE